VTGPGAPDAARAAGIAARAGAAPARPFRGDRGGARETGPRRAERGKRGIVRRTVTVVAMLGAGGAALLLRLDGPPATAQAQAGPPASAPIAVAAPDDVGVLAVAFETGVDAGDAGALLALFAPDAQIKEGVAVLAAGPARVAAWVQACLLPDVRLVPGTRRLGAAAATWDLRDGLGCYWRARPAGFRPAWDVAPGEGTLTVAAAGGRIATLTVVYSAAWEARLLIAQAAPFRTAQAHATARAGQPAAPTPTGAAAPTTRVPAAPSTQDRRTPSVGPWLAALGAALAGGALLALLPRPREAP
jgi:hypothetical protein